MALFNIKSNVPGRLVPFLLLALMGLAYLAHVWRFAQNIPYGFDDVHTFLNQFQRDFLEQPELLKKLWFFFELSNWPHPEVFPRFMETLLYGFQGTVDFRTFLILGNIFFLGFLLVLIFSSGLRPLWLVLPLASLLLVPLNTNFWAVAIVGYPFLFGGVYLCFFWLYRKKPWNAVAAATIATISSGTGYLLFGPAFLMVLAQKDNRRELSVLSIGALALLPYFLFILFSKEPQGGAVLSTAADTGPVLMLVVGKIIFASDFLLQCLRRTLDVSSVAQRVNPNLSILFLAFNTGIGFYLIFYWKRLLKTRPDWLMFLGYLVELAMASVVMRSSGQLFELVEPRYEIYSVFYLSAFLVLSFHGHPQLWRKPWFYLLLSGLFLMLFFQRSKLEWNIRENLKRRQQRALFYQVHNINHPRLTIKPSMADPLLDHIESGLYQPDSLLFSVQFEPSPASFSNDSIQYFRVGTIKGAQFEDRTLSMKLKGYVKGGTGLPLELVDVLMLKKTDSPESSWHLLPMDERWYRYQNKEDRARIQWYFYKPLLPLKPGEYAFALGVLSNEKKVKSLILLPPSYKITL